MVKLLTEGIPEHAWWSGELATCRACGAMMEIEANDNPRITHLMHPMATLVWTAAIVTCPYCRGEAIAKHPMGPRA